VEWISICGDSPAYPGLPVKLDVGRRAFVRLTSAEPDLQPRGRDLVALGGVAQSGGAGFASK